MADLAPDGEKIHRPTKGGVDAAGLPNELGRRSVGCARLTVCCPAQLSGLGLGPTA